jgi:hypothetical protein
MHKHQEIKEYRGCGGKLLGTCNLRVASVAFGSVCPLRVGGFRRNVVH